MSLSESTSPFVHVVDDDPDLRASLAELLGAMGYAVRADGSASEFCAASLGRAPGCLLLAMQLSGETGLEFYQRLVRDGRRLPVIFVTDRGDVSTAVAAMKLGAIDFLEKPLERAVLRGRIEQALAVDRQWRASDERYERLSRLIDGLTAQERETLAMVVAGESNKSMAARLFISQRAVEMRRARMMRKLNLSSSAELFDVAITHRVLSEMRQLAGPHRLSD